MLKIELLCNFHTDFGQKYLKNTDETNAMKRGLTFFFPCFIVDLRQIYRFGSLQSRVVVEQVCNESQVQFVVAVNDFPRCQELSAANLVRFLQHSFSTLQVVWFLNFF